MTSSWVRSENTNQSSFWVWAGGGLMKSVSKLEMVTRVVLNHSRCKRLLETLLASARAKGKSALIGPVLRQN